LYFLIVEFNLFVLFIVFFYYSFFLTTEARARQEGNIRKSRHQVFVVVRGCMTYCSPRGGAGAEEVRRAGGKGGERAAGGGGKIYKRFGLLLAVHT
jgi:hypothetical protein